eukprot:TRINITY_DN17695_c0_g1_i2.p1 TRINITY_DN17695_c0_g1~~TRINITY_DN17695_c0_g1_i2.p1  ORF type:complete len:786 (+),score=159.35 TRINITY_DN17695_c0_g1_i2:102-2459(+)
METAGLDHVDLVSEGTVSSEARRETFSSESSFEIIDTEDLLLCGSDDECLSDTSSQHGGLSPRNQSVEATEQVSPDPPLDVALAATCDHEQDSEMSWSAEAAEADVVMEEAVANAYARLQELRALRAGGRSASASEEDAPREASEAEREAHQEPELEESAADLQDETDSAREQLECAASAGEEDNIRETERDASPVALSSTAEDVEDLERRSGSLSRASMVKAVALSMVLCIGVALCTGRTTARPAAPALRSSPPSLSNATLRPAPRCAARQHLLSCQNPVESMSAASKGLVHAAAFRRQALIGTPSSVLQSSLAPAALAEDLPRRCCNCNSTVEAAAGSRRAEDSQACVVLGSRILCGTSGDVYFWSRPCFVKGRGSLQHRSDLRFEAGQEEGSGLLPCACCPPRRVPQFLGLPGQNVSAAAANTKMLSLPASSTSTNSKSWFPLMPRLVATPAPSASKAEWRERQPASQPEPEHQQLRNQSRMESLALVLADSWQWLTDGVACSGCSNFALPRSGPPTLPVYRARPKALSVWQQLMMESTAMQMLNTTAALTALTTNDLVKTSAASMALVTASFFVAPHAKPLASRNWNAALVVGAPWFMQAMQLGPMAVQQSTFCSNWLLNKLLMHIFLPAPHVRDAQVELRPKKQPSTTLIPLAESQPLAPLTASPLNSLVFSISAAAAHPVKGKSKAYLASTRPPKRLSKLAADGADGVSHAKHVLMPKTVLPAMPAAAREVSRNVSSPAQGNHSRFSSDKPKHSLLDTVKMARSRANSIWTRLRKPLAL